MNNSHLKTVIVTCKFPGCNKGPVQVGGNYCTKHARLVNQSQARLGRSVSASAMTGIALYQKYKPQVDKALVKLASETEQLATSLEPKVAEIKPKVRGFAQETLEKLRSVIRK